MMKLPRFNWLNCSKQVSIAFASVALFAGAASVNIAAMSAEAKQTATQSSADARSLPDGVYLYGQSSKPDEIGKGYFVFESKGGKVAGALYMPFSSFDCASGSFNENQLALKVVNSYDRTSNSYSIALEKTSTVASNAKAPTTQLGLQGFQKLDALSKNDYRMLDICRADVSKGLAQK